jgi:CBS domain-containing protein
MCSAGFANSRRAAQLVHETGASDLAVVSVDGDFVGVLSEGDLLRALLPDQDSVAADSLLESYELLTINGRARANDRIETLVIKDPFVLHPTDDLLRVAEIMTGRMIRRLPVVDNGRLVGTLSRADLCLALLGP